MLSRSLLCRAVGTAFALAVALPLPFAQAHDDAPSHQTPNPISPREAYRPTALPDRIILTWKGDPARSQAVTWRTDSSVTRGVAQIALADAGPKLAEIAATMVATPTPLTTDINLAHCHSVNFENLRPETLYAYRVGDGVNWSEWIQFRTASEKPKPFSFIYFGDAQNDIKSLWSRVIRGAYTDASDARFIVHAGDLVNNSIRDGEWGEWFGAGGWINGMVPSVPTPGNHEYPKIGENRALTQHWRAQFTLPEDAPAGLAETAYYFDYQGVRIISLNSNERQAEQVPWLENLLKNNPNRWTICTFHHPVFSSAKGRDNKEVRELWKPLFDKYRVDLVLTGHDHTYARSNMKTGLNAQDAETGTVYVVSVSGPKMYNLEREPWMQRAAEDTQLYQIISINGGRLKYEARTAVGSLYDGFELVKQRGALNRLIERIPKGVPERLRTRTARAARR